MSNIKLQQLRLQNFKGIKDFTLMANSQNLTVSGANATGKTTIADGLTWLLFDKNTDNKKDFAIKPQDSNGQEIHFLETIVEAVMRINETELKLKKMFSEKWVKGRGKAEAEFTGHETSYWVDDVPVKKNEYQAKINSIINENVFKLLTNPFFFNAQLSWQDRRKTLLEIAGDISDLDVIASTPDLAQLTTILGGRNTEGYRKILHERMKALNEQIAKIPIRIDELNKTLLNEQNVDYEAVEQSLTEQNQALQGIDAELSTASAGATAYREKQQKAYKLRDGLDARTRELDGLTGATLRHLTDEQSSLEHNKYTLDAVIKSLTDHAVQKQQLIKSGEADLVMLRAKFSEEDAKLFAEPDTENFICPTCQQDLPEDSIAQKISELKERFNFVKANALNSINAEGKAIKARVEDARQGLAELTERINSSESNIIDINVRLAELAKEIEAEQAGRGMPNYDADPAYAAIKAELEGLQAELEKPAEEITSNLWTQRHIVTDKMQALQRILNGRDTTEKTKARIDELKVEERTLSVQLAKMEGEKFLLEQFVRQKVGLMEGGINKRFKAVRFKLFDVQINGGINECCETLVNTNGAWVPWSDANHAGQINSGIDIINTLSTHYGITVPCFTDNAEAVNELAEAKGQMIRLVVSQDKELRAEVA